MNKYPFDKTKLYLCNVTYWQKEFINMKYSCIFFLFIYPLESLMVIGQRNEKKCLSNVLNNLCLLVGSSFMWMREKRIFHFLDYREGHTKKNSLCVYLCQGQKNIFYFFLLSRPLSKKHGPGRYQK